MGCKVSKSGVPEPCASKILGCNKLLRSHSSPIQLSDVQHPLRNSKCESFHVVSLTSSTYGSLRLDSMPHLEEERNRADTGNLEDESTFARIMNNRDLPSVTVPYSWSHEIDPQLIASSQNERKDGEKPSNAANCKNEQAVNVWELMESLEDKKAALQMLRGLMEKSKVSGLDSGKSSPLMSSTIHTVEELDSILDVRRSTDQCFRRNSLMGPAIPIRDSQKFVLDPKKMRGISFPMQLNQLPVRNSQEAKELDSVRKRDVCRSQELHPTGRNDLLQRQDLGSVRRSNLTRSQDFESIRRTNVSGDQEFHFTRRNNLSRSQEFVRPPLPKRKEVVATRQSLSEVSRDVCTNVERKIVMSQPDPVLRSPMLKALSGHERLRTRPGQQSPMSRLASPKLSGLHQTSFSFDAAPVLDSNIPASPERSVAKAVIPATINASQRAVEPPLLPNRDSKDTNAHMAMQSAMSKYLESRPIDDSQGVNRKANYNVSKIPPYSLVSTFADNTNSIVPQESAQDVPKISAVKQSDLISSALKGAIPSTTSSSTATPFKTSRQGGRESVMDDSISSGYEVVTNTEVLEEVRMPNGSLPTEQPRQSAAVLPSDTKTGKNTIWSLGLDHPNSLPLDPELLASFEEALELFCADDWCAVRLGESDSAITTGSNSEFDISSWQRGTMDPRENLAGESKLNRYEILDDHVEKPLLQSGTLIKMASLEDWNIVPSEIQEQKAKVDPLQKFEKKCPPGGEERCVLYTTSLRGIRKTFEDCSRTRAILQSSDVMIDERDIAMHAEFRQEMTYLAGKSASVPRLFIRGRYIGGGEEVSQLHEEGTLSVLLEGVPRQVSQAACDGCGGVRFIPCSTCSGSCKVITQEGSVTCCNQCNENGLSRCPICL